MLYVNMETRQLKCPWQIVRGDGGCPLSLDLIVNKSGEQPTPLDLEQFSSIDCQWRPSPDSAKYETAKVSRVADIPGRLLLSFTSEQTSRMSDGYFDVQFTVVNENTDTDSLTVLTLIRGHIEIIKDITRVGQHG